jgi:hypothetical protein
MNTNVKHARNKTFIHYRLHQRVGIKTADDERYIQERYYLEVDTFKKNFFVNNRRIDTDTLFKEVFSILRQGIPDLNLSQVTDFQLGIAEAMTVIAKRCDCTLRVPNEFFKDLFMRVVAQRFNAHIDFLLRYIPVFRQILIDKGVSELASLEMVEAGIEHAETNREFVVHIFMYCKMIVDELHLQCKSRGINMEYEELWPDEMILNDAVCRKLPISG